MRTVAATFTDEAVVDRVVRDLAAAGLTDTAVIQLADVDPPLAVPLLVAVRVEDRRSPAVRSFLAGSGGAIRVARDPWPSS